MNDNSENVNNNIQQGVIKLGDVNNNSTIENITFYDFIDLFGGDNIDNILQDPVFFDQLFGPTIRDTEHLQDVLEVTDKNIPRQNKINDLINRFQQRWNQLNIVRSQYERNSPAFIIATRYMKDLEHIALLVKDITC